MLFDTDVLIEAFKRNERAADLIDGSAARAISIVSYMELLQGAHDADEMRLLKRFMADLAFRVLPLVPSIGDRAATYVERYALSNGLRMADALIAATTVEFGLPLATGNAAHFSYIPGLTVERFRYS